MKRKEDREAEGWDKKERKEVKELEAQNLRKNCTTGLPLRKSLVPITVACEILDMLLDVYEPKMFAVTSKWTACMQPWTIFK